jgi:hypothetical protein
MCPSDRNRAALRHRGIPEEPPIGRGLVVNRRNDRARGGSFGGENKAFLQIGNVDQQNVVRAVTREPQLTRAGESPPVLLPPGSGSMERQRAISPSRDPMRRLGAPCRLPTPLLEWRAEAARFHRLGRTSRRRGRRGSVVRMRSFSTQFGAWPGCGVAVAKCMAAEHPATGTNYTLGTRFGGRLTTQSGRSGRAMASGAIASEWVIRLFIRPQLWQAQFEQRGRSPGAVTAPSLSSG